MAGELIRLEDWYPEYEVMWAAIKEGKKAPATRRGIVIHHTVGSRDDSRSYARAVAHMHWNKVGNSGNPWRRPGGYQEQIGLDGRVFEMTGLGYRGIHSGTYIANRDYIAISFEGDYRRKLPTEAALEAGAIRVAAITQQLRWYGSGPLMKGHRDLWPGTTCPGGQFYVELPSILTEPESGSGVWPNLIRPGDSGEAVAVMKGLLVSIGFPDAASDKYTKEWQGHVRNFQESASLVVDGILGPHTYEALTRAVTQVLP